MRVPLRGPSEPLCKTASALERPALSVCRACFTWDSPRIQHFYTRHTKEEERARRGSGCLPLASRLWVSVSPRVVLLSGGPRGGPRCQNQEAGTHRFSGEPRCPSETEPRLRPPDTCVSWGPWPHRHPAASSPGSRGQGHIPLRALLLPCEVVGFYSRCQCRAAPHCFPVTA